MKKDITRIPERYRYQPGYTLAWDGKPYDAYHPKTHKPACGAKAKNANEFGDHVCLRVPNKNRRTCRNHGGESPVGIASATFKTGKRSRYMGVLKGELAERFQQAVSDPDILHLTKEIALLQARAMSLLGSIDSKHSTEIWNKLTNANEKLAAAQAEGNALEMAFWMNSISDTIKKGSAESMKWVEIYAVFEQLRKLSETEAKRRITEKYYVTIEEQNNLVRFLGELVRENVTDQAALRRISTGLIDFLNTRISRHHLPAGE